MKRKKPAPPLDWLRQSVWAGESPPDELDALEAMLEAAEEQKKPSPRVRGEGGPRSGPGEGKPPARRGRNRPSPTRGEGR